MRREFSDELEAGRDTARPGWATKRGERMGAFRLRCPLTSQLLTVICSDGSDWLHCGLSGEPWEHVSVSTPTRCPTWDEMCWVRDLFFGPEECVLQFHPPRDERYVNLHRHTLHLWRPTAVAIPMPPVECV